MTTSRGRCYLCAPLVATTVADMIRQMHLALEQGADLVELRLDFIVGFDPPSHLPLLLSQKPLPALVTFRPDWEGGKYVGDESSRQDALQLAVDLGADFIDIELKVALDFLANLQGREASGCKVIVSNHNFQSTPSAEELRTMIARMESTGADIIKFVTTANKFTDVVTVLEVLRDCQMPTIGLAMGPIGTVSRILSPKFGGFLTFGSISAGKESAPGQTTLSELRNVYGLGQVSRETKVYGIIGNPVSHSKGPIIHNAAFRAIGYNGIYIPFLVENLKEFLDAFHDPDFAGFSVTIPHKEAAFHCCDELEPLTKAIGAVNTVVRRKADGKLIGYNTDCEGAITAMEDGLKGSGEGVGIGLSPLSGRYFVVIGAGGAGRAIAFGAKQRGAKVVIANRNFERAKALASAVDAEALTLEELNAFRPVMTGMVLANTTSVGMHPNVEDTPISKGALAAYSLVFDAVYTPQVTRLLKEAKEAGATVVSGIEMFIRQAMNQFALFTDRPAPEQVMRETLASFT